MLILKERTADASDGRTTHQHV